MRSDNAWTAWAERCQTRVATDLPTFCRSAMKGTSSSDWSSAVLAGEEPVIGGRRSMATTERPADSSASAIRAPEIPVPTTATSGRSPANLVAQPAVVGHWPATGGARCEVGGHPSARFRSSTHLSSRQSLPVHATVSGSNDVVRRSPKRHSSRRHSQASTRGAGQG